MKELISIQSELNAPKDLYNNFGKYRYRSAESILEALKPLLIKTKCFINVSDEMVMLGDRFYVKATATLSNGTDSVSATAYAREEETKKGMDSAQITGSTSSYARKYALNGLFAIDDNKDPDATNRHGIDDTEKPTATKPTAKKPPAELKILPAVKKSMETAKSRDELITIWNGNKPLQSLPEFEKLIKFHSERVKEK